MDKATPCFFKCSKLAEEIFKQLNNQDLIRCSQINRVWYETSERLQWTRKIQKFSKQNFVHETTWRLILVQIPKEYLKILASACEKDVEAIEQLQCSPLHTAACCENSDLFNCILTKFDNRNPKDKYGRTPFHIAANAGNNEICKLYVKEEEIKNPKDHHEWTPLHYAASKGHLEISKLICKSYGKSFDSFDRGLSGSQLTALHHAASGGHLELCRYLVSIMDNKNPKDIYGYTPLHAAAKGGHLEIYRLIGHQVKDRNPEDNNRIAPLKHALDNHNYDICKLIYSLTNSEEPKSENVSKKKKKRRKKKQE